MAFTIAALDGTQNGTVQYDSAGLEVTIGSAVAIGSTKGQLVMGSDGTNARFLKTDSSGILAPPADVTSTGALGALNAAVTVALNGMNSVGFQIAAGTISGTLTPEVSFDGGTTYNATKFWDSTTGLTSTTLSFGGTNSAFARSFIMSGGASHARVRMSSYASGTASGTIRATTVPNNVPDPYTFVAASTVAPQMVALTGALVGSANPSYSNGAYQPLSSTLTGALRVDGGIIATGASLGSTKPVLVGGSQSGAMQPMAVDVNGYVRTLGYPAYQQDALQFGTTITANGSADEGGVGSRELQINIDLRSAPTGTLPTITFFAQDVDPSDQTTLVAGTQTSGPTFSAAGTGSFTHYARSNIVRVSWVVTGTTPSFTNCYVYVTQKQGGTAPLEDRVTSSVALGAINAASSISLAGAEGVAMQLAAGTLAATLTPELSFDGGTNWFATYFDDPATGSKTATLVFTNPNALTARTIVGAGGASHARVRVSAYTSGTANVILRASTVDDPSVLYTGPSNSTIQPPLGAQMAGWDGTTLRSIGASAKGTQPPFAVGTQDLKDAGRSQVMLSWEEMTGTVAAESALTNFTLGSKAGVALTAATSYTVTAGKTLRIQEVTIYVKATSTINNLARFRIRMAATVANTSPVIFDKVMSLNTNAVTANQAATLAVPIPDGLEVAAGQQITFTWFTSAATSTVGMSIIGYEY